MDLNLSNKNSNNSFIENFTKELENALNDFSKKTSNSINALFKENTNYIITDIDQITKKLSLVNIYSNEDIEIFCKTSTNKDDTAYYINKEDFKILDIASCICLENNKIKLIAQKYEFDNIKNNDVKLKLQDMYFNLEQTKNSKYEIVNIDSSRIYLTDCNEGGYFSISKEFYPNLEIGNIVSKENGKYILIERK